MPRLPVLTTRLSVLFMLPSLIAATPVLGAAPPRGQQARATLIASTTAIAPSQPFMVGVLFDINPNWHIYWTNPGDSGEPTEIQWTLPEGFTVSDVQYPLPHRFVMPGNIVGYGYANQVLLMAIITPPAQLNGSTVEIGAHPTWLVCESVCIPGEDKLSLTLPVASASEPAESSEHAKMFSQWSASVPVPVEEADAPLRTLRTVVKRQGDESIVALTFFTDAVAPAVPVGSSFKDKKAINEFALKQKQLPIAARLALRRQLLAELERDQRKAQGLPVEPSKTEEPTTKPTPKLEWFPPYSETMNFSKSEVETLADTRQMRVTFHVAPLSGEKLEDKDLTGVLSYKVGDEPTQSAAVTFNPTVAGKVAKSSSEKP